MRSLFHFPFPCTQPPSQQPSPTATVPLQPEMSHRPHPAPVRHRRRSPALLSAVRPLPALIAPPPPEYRPAAARTHWARLVHIAPTARRRPRPPLALRRPRALGWQESHRMHPFLPNARKRPPSWQHPPEMHALRDQNGNILAPCIHSRAQSGDSGYMARESCRQGPFFASRNPKSRMARRCCQRRPAFPRQRHAVRPNGLCALLSRFAVRDPPHGPRTDASRHLRAAPIPPAARTHRVQETSGTTQTTQCGHKNRIPKWGPY